MTLGRRFSAHSSLPSMIRAMIRSQTTGSTLLSAAYIHSIARAGFEEDYPQLTQWLQAFKMDSELLFSLENEMFNSDADASDYEDIVKAWMAENQEYVDGLTASM